MKRFWKTCCAAALSVATLVGCDDGSGSAAGGGGAGGKVKIGYLVKQAEEPWFQTEWAFAQKAADEKGFELLKIGTPDGEKVLAAIDNLAANQAQGFIICTPDVRLGPAIVAKAMAHNLKLMTVDDQFVANDKVMDNVHHLGVAARDVGRASGQALADEYKKRGWTPADTAVCVVTRDELDTARERTQGVIEKLVENGFPKERIFTTPQKTTDIPGGFEAANVLFTQQGGVKHWLIAGMNDNAVLGAVRAAEGRGFNADTAVGIGINGTDCIDELKKPPTAFYGSILMEANLHGYETAVAMHKWITEGVEPEMAKFTGGVLITRADFEQKLKEHGMWR